MAAGLALAACAAPPRPSTPAASTSAESVAVAVRPTSHPLIGHSAPGFALRGADGATISNASISGRWTVIAFVGAWCGDCRRDVPYLAALARAIDQDPDLNILAIIDERASYGDHLDAMRTFAVADAQLPMAIDEGRKVYDAFRMSWLPSYVVVDPDGVVRGFRTDLSTDTAGEGGVKRFIQDIAALRGAARD
jgi:peroxiredoxin